VVYVDSLKQLDAAEFVFLDPDNSVSEQSRKSVRGGKWASVTEVLGFATTERSVAWISHPRQIQRSAHHHRKMAKFKQMPGEFYSVYQGHIGIHFLLCEQHRGIASQLQKLVRSGMDSSLGLWRYADSIGVFLNMDAPPAQKNKPIQP
jgi:hypothetical protein